MTDHRYFAFGKSKTMVPLSSLEEAIAALGKTDYVWFDFHNPERAELVALAEPLGLDALSIEDVLDEDQIPKIEAFPTYTFLLVNGYQYAQGELTLVECDFCLGKNFLVTSNRSEGERWPGAHLDERLRHNADLKRGPEFLCHAVLDYIVDAKFTAIEKLQEDLEAAEEAILGDVLHFKPERLLRLRRRLLTVRKSLLHEREVLTRICRKDSPFIDDKSIYGFRDVYDHIVRFFETTEIAREEISSLMEMFLSMLNNRMTMAANQMSMTVKRLTYVTTIFMPLTLLAGLGGMSEWSMMTGPKNWKVSYPAFFAGMAVIAALNYLLFRWVDRRRKTQMEAGLAVPPVEFLGALDEARSGAAAGAAASARSPASAGTGPGSVTAGKERATPRE